MVRPRIGRGEGNRAGRSGADHVVPDRADGAGRRQPVALQYDVTEHPPGVRLVLDQESRHADRAAVLVARERAVQAGADQGQAQGLRDIGVLTKAYEKLLHRRCRGPGGG